MSSCTNSSPSIDLRLIEWMTARGWRLLPIQPRTKRPLSDHAVHDASSDLTVIAEWLRRWPSMNIAVACGAPGPQVLDIDSLDQVPPAVLRAARSAPAFEAPGPDTPTSPGPSRAQSFSITASCVGAGPMRWSRRRFTPQVVGTSGRACLADRSHRSRGRSSGPDGEPVMGTTRHRRDRSSPERVATSTSRISRSGCCGAGSRTPARSRRTCGASSSARVSRSLRPHQAHSERSPSGRPPRRSPNASVRSTNSRKSRQR